MPANVISATPKTAAPIQVTQLADSYLTYSDMANTDADLPIEGLLTPQESVAKMLAVILAKTIDDTGTFWTWEGKVSTAPFHITGCFCSSAYPFPSPRVVVPMDASTHNVRL